MSDIVFQSGPYNNDIVFQAGHYTVGVDTARLHGYFEHDILGDNSGGELWFARSGDRLELTDYDGVWALPREVVDGLKQHNFIVSEDF